MNHRHTDFQSVALPTELPARKTQKPSISELKFNPKKNDIASNLKEFAGYAASCPTGKVSSTPGEHQGNPPCGNPKLFIREVLA